MKRIIVLILTLCLLAVPVFAQSPYICDHSGLLTESEVTELEKLYAKESEKTGVDFVFLTVDSFEGASSGDYARAYYDEHGYSEDGILLLVSIPENSWYVLTSGVCRTEISNQHLTILSENLLFNLMAKSYYDAAVEFLQMSEVLHQTGTIEIKETEPKEEQTRPTLSLDQPEETDKTDKPTKPQKTPNGTGKVIAISMGVGLLLGAATVGVMALPMKSVKSKAAAGEYVRRDSMVLTENRDVFLYSRVTRTPKAKNNNAKSSGRSRSGKH